LLCSAMLWLPRTEAHRSSLADAVNVMALSNARRAEVENALDVVRAQVNRDSAKDFNAGRLFRLEIDNADLQKELSLYKVALDEARQLIMSNAQQSQVDLPKQIETLRGELRAAESALLSSERSRDAALKELDRLRFDFSSFKTSTEIQSSRYAHDNALLRSKFAKLPDLMRASPIDNSSPNVHPKSIDFAAIFQATQSPRAGFVVTNCCLPQEEQLEPKSEPKTMHDKDTPYAGIGIRLGLNPQEHPGKVVIRASAMNISSLFRWYGLTRAQFILVEGLPIAARLLSTVGA